MIRRLLCILLIAGIARASRANDDVYLRTCKGVRTWLLSGGAANQPFDVTGRLVIGINRRAIPLIALEDATDTTVFDVSNISETETAGAKPGDVIRLTGSMHALDRNTTALAYHLSTVKTGDPIQPPLATGSQLVSGGCNFRPVRVRGRLLDIFDDEIDPEWSYLILSADGSRIYVFFPRFMNTLRDSRLVDATVEVTGFCNRLCGGSRQLLGPYLTVNEENALRMVSPAPADPYDSPLLEDIRGLNASAVEGFGRRRVAGTVLAVSQTRSFILSADDGRTVSVIPAQAAPVCGTHVEVCGRVSTDVYHINLHRAIWRNAPGKAADPPVSDVSAIDLLTDTNRNPMIKAEFHGKPIRLEGVIRSLPAEGGRERRLHMESCGILVPVDPGLAEAPFAGLERGCRISVSGVCCMEISQDSRLDTFPRIESFSLILRSPNDIAVLGRPSWWTPARLAALVGALLAILVGFCIWNIFLNRLVERRSRELMRARVARDEARLKTEERMRLAVELHDTIAQEMTGVAMQIDAAELAAENDPSRLGGHLVSARQRLRSCRENLRHCLWDLRNRPFETRRLADAIRRTVAPHLGNAQLSVTSELSCHEFSDNAIHAILCILRELSVNAIRHGQASRIAISARRTSDGIALRVADNGVGFDSQNHLGPAQGHFGLLGVTERVTRLNGVIRLDSGPNKGTVATITHLNPET